MKSRILILSAGIVLLLIALHFASCSSSRVPVVSKSDTLILNREASGELIRFSFHRGKSHNHPLMALWITDVDTHYIQTLYVAKSIARGVFEHGDPSTGKWLPGPIRRPAALPVWAHSRGVKEEDGLFMPTADTPVPDAYSGPTPPDNFQIILRTDQQLPDTTLVFFEINQTWDWNEYWTNNKYPDDEDYKSSCQPSLVYLAKMIKSDRGTPAEFSLIGHGHYSGDNGKIFTDLSTITTAKEITDSLAISIDPDQLD